MELLTPVRHPKVRAAERLEVEISELAGHLAAATCRFLLLIAEFDRLDGWVGHRSCAQWLSWRCGLSASTARRWTSDARPGRSTCPCAVRCGYATRSAAGSPAARPGVGCTRITYGTGPTAVRPRWPISSRCAPLIIGPSTKAVTSSGSRRRAGCASPDQTAAYWNQPQQPDRPPEISSPQTRRSPLTRSGRAGTALHSTWTTPCSPCCSPLSARSAAPGGRPRDELSSLKNYLLSTGDRVLVGTSPYDRIRGIGLSASQARSRTRREPSTRRSSQWPVSSARR
ncbi:MAG: hypothetical protein JWR24_2877 [Actinoallomurus sp.]|nr:hypothetical protein [Actinoallomurus sp.]